MVERDSLPEETVFCVGIYGSASTWAYNFCRLLMTMKWTPRPVTAYYSESPLSERPQTRPDPFAADAQPAAAVVKLHDGSDEAACLIEAGRVATVLTIRDPRDGLASVMQRFRWSFPVALDHVVKNLRFVDRILQSRRTILLRYEDGFMQDPAAAEQLARFLGASPTLARSPEILGQLSRQSVEATTQQFQEGETHVGKNTAGRLYHHETHWHQGHFGDGQVGKWRHELSRAQRAQIRTAAWREITRLGYAGYGW